MKTIYEGTRHIILLKNRQWTSWEIKNDCWKMNSLTCQHGKVPEF